MKVLKNTHVKLHKEVILFSIIFYFNFIMNVSKWGPSFWTSLHTITFNAPLKCNTEQRKIYENYFTSVGDILPCKWCRMSYKLFLKYLPIQEYSDSRSGLTYWLYIIHNVVNMKLNRKCDLTFRDIVLHYETFRVSKDTDTDLFVKETLSNYGKITHLRMTKLIEHLNNNNWEF